MTSNSKTMYFITSTSAEERYLEWWENQDTIFSFSISSNNKVKNISRNDYTLINFIGDVSAVYAAFWSIIFTLL